MSESTVRKTYVGIASSTFVSRPNKPGTLFLGRCDFYPSTVGQSTSRRYIGPPCADISVCINHTKLPEASLVPPHTTDVKPLMCIDVLESCGRYMLVSEEFDGIYVRQRRRPRSVGLQPEHVSRRHVYV